MRLPGTRGWRRAAIVGVPVLLLAVLAMTIAWWPGSGDVDTATSPSTAAPDSTPRPSGTPPSTTGPGDQPGASAPGATAPGGTGPATGPPATTTSPEPARVISTTGAGRRTAALTFDAGSDAGHATQILDILGANGIRATFGVTGRFAERYPAIVRRIAAEGHQLVNHSYDHPSFTGRSTSSAPLSAAQRAQQLQRAESAIVAAAGSGTAGWFRPPYGDIDDSVVRDVAAAGWPTVLMWTVDSLGWQGIGADAVVERCLSRAEPGVIYLFHVGQDSDDAAGLQRIIDGLRDAGYAFDSVGNLVGA